MFINRFGPVLTAIPQPLWEGEGSGAGAGAADGGTSSADGNQGTQSNDGTGTGDQNGSAAFNPEVAYAALDQDTREWLQSKDLAKDPAKLAQSAREAEKLISNSIRIPGKDATPEERDAFFNKLGRPAKPDGYEFTPPKDLPENLPYDAAKANEFKAKAHALGLTKDQAAAMHDLYISEVAGAFGNATASQAAALQQRGEKALETLETLWGPIDGEKAKANLELADKVFTDVPGGQEFLAELKELGIVGANKEIFSAPLAKMLSALGGAMFTEDSVLRGQKDEVGNPFADGATFNMTQQMKLVKEDPDRARSLAAAAGKKPADFGL